MPEVPLVAGAARERQDPVPVEGPALELADVAGAVRELDSAAAIARTAASPVANRTRYLIPSPLHAPNDRPRPGHVAEAEAEGYDATRAGVENAGPPAAPPLLAPGWLLRSKAVSRRDPGPPRRHQGRRDRSQAPDRKAACTPSYGAEATSQAQPHGPSPVRRPAGRSARLRAGLGTGEAGESTGNHGPPPSSTIRDREGTLVRGVRPCRWPLTKGAMRPSPRAYPGNPVESRRTGTLQR